eukprot:TRINITY_DN2440_c0_g1_i14.p1 TRINITY_DN2440_c0_g1~~TRINITY_DN2440_c0_g1_i14.p1  ORF type:complete len:336 (+),score=59.02 TRINITY_DN2440_c0_g1_i14:971-1978(+)
MSYLDTARVIEIKLGGFEALSKAVARRVKTKYYSLVCGLLAGLCVHEVITTNYNQMYEVACKAIDINLSVLPYSPASNCDRWILKLHGCVSHPSDIVLTREHYIRYTLNRSALSGIVQSLLITKHMLFVGFSMKDDNFHRIIDEVRRAVRETEPLHEKGKCVNEPAQGSRSSCSGDSTLGSDRNGDSKVQSRPLSPKFSKNTPKLGKFEKGRLPNDLFGTQLSLSENSITKMLWNQEVDVVAIDEDEQLSRKQQARTLEIFIDYMLSLSTTTTEFLMNPQYDAILQDNQRSLRDYLHKVTKEIPDDAKKSPEYLLFKKFLLEIGWQEDLEEQVTS